MSRLNQLLILTLLSSNSLLVFADRVHPNNQPLKAPEYTDQTDSDSGFRLPPVNSSDRPAQSNGADLNLQLKKINLTGNTVFTDQQLLGLVNSFLNKPIRVSDLEQISFIISQYYSRQGYVNSGAFLPEQNLLDGELTVQIIEGQLTSINIKGQGWLHPDYIRHRLMDDKPLNIQTLQERYLMLLNDPLIKRLKGNLQPTGVLGESLLDLTVTRNRPYGLSIQGNNYRAPSIGAEQFVASGWVRNLSRWGDLVDFSFAISEGSKSYTGGIQIPLNSQGTLFDFHFNLGNSAIIEEPLSNIDIKSEVENFSWTLSHPVYQSLNHTVSLGLSFASRGTLTTSLGEPFPFSDAPAKNRVSVVRIFQEYLGRFENHVFALRSTFNVGVDAFNSTIQANGKPDSEFFSWLGQLQYAFKALDNGAQLKVRGVAQFSNETLLSQERLSVGGINNVRGYRQNELVRDQGYTGSLEFHYPLIGQVTGKAHKLVIIPFMDYGAAWNVGGPTDYLHSVGIGLHWQPIQYIQADFYYGYALQQARPKTQYNLQDDGLYFNVTLSSF